MAEVKWIKIATEIFDNKKIRLIESMPEGDAIIVIWFKLLMLAGQVNDGGMVYFTKDIPFTEQMLSTYFNRSLQVIQLALRTFEKFGMIQIVDDVILVSNWEEYQNVNGLEKIREQTRKRVQKHRELKKLECNASCNVTVTQSNATDIEEEKEEEREENNKKVADTPVSSKKPQKEYTGDNLLDEAIKDFIGHRKALKKPMTDKAIDLFISKLDKMADTTAEKIDLINNAIEHGWLTVYPIKEDNKSNAPKLFGQPPSMRKYNEEQVKDLENIEALYLEEVVRNG